MVAEETVKRFVRGGGLRFVMELAASAPFPKGMIGRGTEKKAPEAHN